MAGDVQISEDTLVEVRSGDPLSEELLGGAPASARYVVTQLSGLLDDEILIGSIILPPDLFANLPSPGSTPIGALFFPLDLPIIYRNSGFAWTQVADYSGPGLASEIGWDGGDLGAYPAPGITDVADAVEKAYLGALNEVAGYLLAYAPKASPALTGTPTAPTAAPGTNTTQISTTAFVQAAIAALINSAPGALDTLDELAAAMGDDANFAATVTTALAGKQPLDQTLTDIAAVSDTAFGRALLALADAAALRTAAGLGTMAVETATDYARNLLTINAQTGTSYTPVLGDLSKLITCSNAGAITFTWPQDSDVAIPVGGQIHVAQLGAGQVTSAAGTGATVNSTPGLKHRAQYSVVTGIKRAANTWLLTGDLAA